MYLVASCWLYMGGKGLGGSLLAEDPFPHLQPQKVHVATQGDLTGLF